jgi:hypothetical protein
MDKQVIIDALDAQIKVKQEERNQYEKTIYLPALAELDESIKQWLSSELSMDVYEVKYKGDNDLDIIPTIIGSGTWTYTISILKRSDYGGKYFYEINYRSSLGKVQDDNIYYLTTLGKIAANFSVITEKMENDWENTYQVIRQPYIQLKSKLNDLEYEVNKLAAEKAVADRETYKAVGFEHTVAPQIVCKTNYDTNEYELVETSNSCVLTTGRGKWDYIHVNSYRVVGPAKYNKIALIVKTGASDKWRDIEVKYDYFDQFIQQVYHWEMNTKHWRDADETKRYNKYIGKTEE